MKWRRGHVERRLPNHVDWAPADWGNVIADALAGQGWQTHAALKHNEPGTLQGETPGGMPGGVATIGTTITSAANSLKSFLATIPSATVHYT